MSGGRRLDRNGLPASAPRSRWGGGPDIAATAFLASVSDVAEALVAAAGGADIIDAKNPHAGALGALPVAMVKAIRAALPPPTPLSATIGDLPADPSTLVEAARQMASSGCDIVKVGFFPGGDARAAIAALGSADLGGAQPVGLLLADRAPDFTLIPHMARAGFIGVMLDTADKDGGSLTDQLSPGELSHFIALATQQGLFAGLAGALRLSHVPSLLRLKPHVLGFRGALCVDTARTGDLSSLAVRAVRAALNAPALDQNRAVVPGEQDGRDE
jgi:(5-formylfuran-3-yl)methyl phosphate synthase